MGWCDNKYQCPAQSCPKPNRICYNDFDDCECDSGYKKDGSRCVPVEPCVQIQCSSGTELVGDINGCGGKCEPCAVPFCSPGTQLIGMDGNGCGGTCEPLHVAAQTSDGNQLRGSKDPRDNGYQCPAFSYRKPNRKCYDNFDDCECDSGFKKDGSRCVPEEPCVQIQCSIGTE